jgi:outer membrane protein
MSNWRINTLLLTCGILQGQTGNPPQLTLAEARAMALKNHPQILASQASYLRADQVTRETRSPYFPTLNGEVTAAQAEINSRIGAGILNDSRLFNHVGAGVTLSQLITDSGRTRNLVAHSNLQAQASRQDYQATRYDVVLAVDQAYYEVLLAEQLVTVARQTVTTRQAVVDQVTELTKNKLKSDVDLSFAQVNLADAKLMMLRGRDRLNSAYAQLAQTLGTQQHVRYELKEEAMPADPPAEAEALIAQGLQNRPELASMRLQTQAAQKFVEAERDLKRPSVTLTAVGGALPYINPGNANPGIDKTYESAAVNVQIPIFNGFLFSARRQAAEYQLRTAYERAKTSFEAIATTQQLLTQANLAMSLAQGRYDLGLASIVELTQAQLGQTSAQVETLNAKYQYQEAYAELQYTLGLLH